MSRPHGSTNGVRYNRKKYYLMPTADSTTGTRIQLRAEWMASIRARRLYGEEAVAYSYTNFYNRKTWVQV